MSYINRIELTVQNGKVTLYSFDEEANQTCCLAMAVQDTKRMCWDEVLQSVTEQVASQTGYTGNNAEVLARMFYQTLSLLKAYPLNNFSEETVDFESQVV